MWTLYDFLPSGNGYKVRLALRELGRPFIYQEVDILRGESREPWFLDKNPVGEIPVLELEARHLLDREYGNSISYRRGL